MERNLINEAGSLDAPGRPTLFVTTDQFLIDFGLRSVKDLPPMEMLMYGTLRDFERSLEIAAGHRRDDQMTIDQLVDAFLPEPPDKLDKNDTQASE
jgi:segregation and condensation protein B